MGKSNVLRIKLSDIPDELHPDDTVTCHVNGQPHDATFVRYGEDEFGREWRRKIWVQVNGLHEVRPGMVRPDMFGSYTDEYIVNQDGTASTGLWQ